jgi:hypothetical protein
MPSFKHEKKKRNLYEEVVNKTLQDKIPKKSNINIMLIGIIILIIALISAWLYFSGYFTKTKKEDEKKVIEKYFDIDTGVEIPVSQLNAGLFEEVKEL